MRLLFFSSSLKGPNSALFFLALFLFLLSVVPECLALAPSILFPGATFFCRQYHDGHALLWLCSAMCNLVRSVWLSIQHAPMAHTPSFRLSVLPSICPNPPVNSCGFPLP